jgi:hypothetical protein
MPLPDFNEIGDLPQGVYHVTFTEVIAHFGAGSPQRGEVTARLQRIHSLALETRGLDRLIVFGSYVTDKVEPNDVDVVLIMRDDFRPASVSAEGLALFDHGRAAAELGASIFWVRPGMLFGTSMEQFIAEWQLKRDGGRRGIVEVRA